MKTYYFEFTYFDEFTGGDINVEVTAEHEPQSHEEPESYETWLGLGFEDDSPYMGLESDNHFINAIFESVYEYVNSNIHSLIKKHYRGS